MPCLSVVTWSSGFTSSSSSLMNFFSWPHILSNLILPLIIYLLFLSTGEQTPARTAGFPWMFTFLWSSCMYFLNLLPFLFIISMSSSCLCLPLTPFSLHYYSITLSVFTPFHRSESLVYCSAAKLHYCIIMHSAGIQSLSLYALSVYGYVWHPCSFVLTFETHTPIFSSSL